MKLLYQTNGIHYSFQLRPMSFREREAIAANIKPDPSCKPKSAIQEDPEDRTRLKKRHYVRAEA